MDNNMTFWTGVVEDRNDPEQLGRCRVRIFGVHTENIVDLPTEDLPWAMPLQSITSAAISGVGTTPVGIVPGSWVMGFFLDGADAQKPVILGTVAGKPASNPLVQQAKQQEFETSPNVLTDGSGNVVRDGSGQPIQTTSFEDPLDGFGNLVKGEVNRLIEGIGTYASNNDYSKEEDGKLGKYQFSYTQLVMLGYAYRPVAANTETELTEQLNPENLNDPAFWTGKAGVYSKEDFLNKFSVQNNAMIEMLTYNHKNLVRLGKINKDTEPGIIAGLLSSAHIGGYSNADKLGRKTGDQLLRQAFLVGAEAVTALNIEPDQNIIEERGTYLPLPSDELLLNSEEFSNLAGFQDPNKQYPKYEYDGHSDLNKLALGEDDHNLFKIKENKRVTEIPKARTTDTWEEPKPVFGAKYPYNQVLETEAGHVIELDSTPGAERIHVFHKTGTYMEVDVNGSMVRKVAGDNYEVIDKNNYVFVKGAETITVEGKTRILVKDQAFLEVEGGLSITSGKGIAIQAAEDMALIANRFELSSTTGIDFTSKGPVNIQGTSVNISATDGSIVNAATKSIYDTAGEEISYSSGTNTRMQAGQQFDIKSGTNTNIDAGGQLNIRMGQAQAATKQSVKDKTPRATPPQKSPVSEEPDPLDRDTKGQTSNIGDDDYDGIGPEWREQEIAKDRMSETVAIQKVDDKTTFGRSNTDPNDPTDCSQFKKLRVFSRSLQISRRYKLGDFNKGGWVFRSQSGLPLYKIVCNLSNVAKNVVEPIRDKYPSVKITSGYRNVTSKFPNEASDHLRGCAVDIQFDPNSVPLKEYRDVAVWIQQNIPYKQLLLEYEKDANGKTTKAWIHISLELAETSGAPIPSGKTPVGTVLNHRLDYPNQLINLA